jgi:CheY-like chemotaxis protein
VIDVMLIDFSLRGGEDGLSLTQSLRNDSEWADVPIIAVTAHALSKDQRNALEVGCSDYLSKPFESGVLLKMVDRLLREGTER